VHNFGHAGTDAALSSSLALTHDIAVCRMALVQVLFESRPGPAIMESDPELRAVLLDSLKTYERDEAQRPAFQERAHIHVPEASPSAGIVLTDNTSQTSCIPITYCVLATILP